jgi:hypothetical protein
MFRQLNTAESEWLKGGSVFMNLVSVLLNGDVKSQPEYDEKHEQYKYRVEGNTIDGDSAAAITVIVSTRSLLVVTIFEGASLGSS